MQSTKCRLYIVGTRRIGGIILKQSIATAIQTKRTAILDIFNEHEWIINTESDLLIVELKEHSTLRFLDVHPESPDFKDTIIYILDKDYYNYEFSARDKDIERLRNLSSNSTIIIAYTNRPIEYDNKIKFQELKQLFPFVEYFLPILEDHMKEYDGGTQIGLVIRQILVNIYTSSLNLAKELIRQNLATNEPILDLGNLGITSLNQIKELFLNTHLKTLILSNEWGEYQDGTWIRKISKNSYNKTNRPNILFSLPREIAKLENLEILIAGGNWNDLRRRTRHSLSNWYISNLEPLRKLRNLSTLNLSNNNIESTNPLIYLSNLKKIYLNNNTIGAFPSIQYFPNLKELYLSNNKIRTVKFLSNASSVIQTIDLHSNLISDLTPIKELISKIGIQDSKWENKTISIARNPLSIPPAEVVAKGKQNIIAYFTQLEAENKIQIKPFKNEDIKLIIVGNTYVGKSTFVKWLTTGKIEKNLPTTHWLDFETWEFVWKSKKYKVRIFDFGGQEYYHDTHHLFFTNGTAYVLLWEQLSNQFNQVEINQTQTNGENIVVKVDTFPIEYWLDSIRYHTQKRKLSQTEKSIAKILDERDKQHEDIKIKIKDWGREQFANTIETQTEFQEEENILVLQNKVDISKNKKFINEEKIKSDYPNISDFEEISIYNKTKLELSRQSIFEIFDSLDILKRQFLGTWNYIKKDIENRIFKKSLSILEFRTYCNDIIRNLPELAGKAENKQEEVLFSANDARVFASFLADIGLCLYYPDNVKLKNKIFLNQKQILDDLNKILLRINRTNGEISESDIAESLKESLSQDSVEDVINLMLHFKILFRHPFKNKKAFIAPLYLPDNPPKSIQLFQSLFEKPVYRFEYETFIHKSIILDFFHTYGAKALTESSDESSFYFWKNGIIIKDENSTDIIMVEFIPWDKNKKSAALDIYALNCKNEKFTQEIVDHIDSINEGINVNKLVPSESHDDFIPLELIHKNEIEQNPIFQYGNKYHRITSFKKYLKSPLKMKKIFISYSKKDLRLVTKFIEHLSTLQRDGKISKWYCSELEAGSVWNDEIQKHLEESDIVCFMISSNFIKTDYIHDHEIKKALDKKAKEPHFKIVPIILNFCRWTTINNNLGYYTALPYTAKPVVDFKNQDMAWYIIEECLRLMIENDLEPTGRDFFKTQKLPPDVLEIYTRIVEGKVEV